jgi:hypothetical protein
MATTFSRAHAHTHLGMHAIGPPTAHAPSAARAPAQPRVPVASIAMADLWAELNRRRDGES